MNLNRTMTNKKSYYTFIFFCILSINTFGQKLIPYQFSNDLSIDFPQEFSIADTLGQKVIQSALGDDLILVMQPTDKINDYLEDQSELLKFYESFLKGMVDKSKGKLIKKELVTINGFHFFKSSFSTKITGTENIWTNYVLLLNQIPYSFLLISPSENGENTAFFEKKIINSIKIKNNLTAQNQFNTNQEDSQAYKIGKLIGSLCFYGLIGAMIVFFIVKDRKKKMD
ncbi:hypothetical protein [Chryseobacterium foetidum]|uniref:hypothetical protein n=1 Tax=Chryseobacterium foetidum TaxID=2951057 RepID=UPI0021C5D8FC|nr:hypothetical protein [Chryseobacterium foetidum]